MKLLKTLFLIAASACWTGAGAQIQPEPCKSVYLTFDTGHMGVAPLVAEVLRRQDVKVTFFAAHEPTQQGDGSLGAAWAPWWKARAAEGHEFASHTWQHAVWRGDVAPARAGRGDGSDDGGDAGGQGRGETRFRVQPTAGPQAGQRLVWTARQYCDALALASDRLASVTGRRPLPLFRAPGGKTSPALLAAAERCGYRHVGWAPAGFLGDELPSATHPNDQLLRQALAGIRAGDVLMAHLGIWSRQDPWAPAALEPLITGLKARGFCFRTLRAHPDLQGWIARHGG
jgi:peptidoglycan/xylan/chitin deacetylase (PgdA/CDA1 family)